MNLITIYKKTRSLFTFPELRFKTHILKAVMRPDDVSDIIFYGFRRILELIDIPSGNALSSGFFLEPVLTAYHLHKLVVFSPEIARNNKFLSCNSASVLVECLYV